MANALLDAVIVRLPVSWLLAFTVNMGFYGVYTGQAVSLLFPAIVGLLYFKSKVRESKRPIHRTGNEGGSYGKCRMALMPVCKSKTHIKVRANTELKNFPLVSSVIKEPDAQTKSRLSGFALQSMGEYFVLQDKPAAFAVRGQGITVDSEKLSKALLCLSERRWEPERKKYLIFL